MFCRYSYAFLIMCPIGQARMSLLLLYRKIDCNVALNCLSEIALKVYHLLITFRYFLDTFDSWYLFIEIFERLKKRKIN